MFLTKDEIKEKGIECGDNVFISDKCSIYGNIKIANNVRIDDFCILSGEIILGSNIHIGAYCGLYGKMGIIMSDYTGLSPRCTIFSASDDFSGNYLISPMNPMIASLGLLLMKQFYNLDGTKKSMPDLALPYPNLSQYDIYVSN